MKIGLIGTFDVENFGDCLFPELYQHLLAQHRPDTEITLYSPRPVCAEILSFDAVRALPADLSDTQAFDEDALILIGGETIGVGHSSGTYNFARETLSAFLRLWTAPVLAQLDPTARPRFFGAHCVGARKMPAETNKRVAQVLSGASYCSFRDAFSAEWIQTAESRFAQEIDPMFLIDHLCGDHKWATLAQKHLPQGITPDGYLVAHMTMGYGGNDLDAWCAAVGALSQETGLPVVLLPICHFLNDERFLAAAQSKLSVAGIRTHLIRGKINVKETAALVGQSAGYIGSSLHGAVTAVAFAKPLAVLGHSMDGKHEGSLRAVGINGAVTTSPGDLPDCFRRTDAMDHSDARQRAQSAARASFDRLLCALDTAPQPSRAVAEQAKAAAAALHQSEMAEVPPGSAAEIKRLAFRALTRVPALDRPYRAFRMRQKLGSAIRG
ncbi:MAG: polysaccharide pyruvyl transferase family protein [Pseudomonadota bacterium]